MTYRLRCPRGQLGPMSPAEAKKRTPAVQVRFPAEHLCDPGRVRGSVRNLVVSEQITGTDPGAIGGVQSPAHNGTLEVVGTKWDSALVWRRFQLGPDRDELPCPRPAIAKAEGRFRAPTWHELKLPQAQIGLLSSRVRDGSPRSGHFRPSAFIMSTAIVP